eukprot:SAG31_NODE_19101_length_612_cov_0.927875_1_plen_64_part_10
MTVRCDQAERDAKFANRQFNLPSRHKRRQNLVALHSTSAIAKACVSDCIELFVQHIWWARAWGG